MNESMTNRYFYSFAALVFSMLVCVPQGFAQNCEAERELIFKMNAPRVGSYNVWDAHVGEQDSTERMVSGFFDETGLLVVAGELIPKDESGRVELVVAGLGRRGRLMWSVKPELKGLTEVVKILPEGKGFIVFANYAAGKDKSGIWLGHFDAVGKLLSKNTITDAKGSVVMQDVVRTHDGKNFMLASTLEPKGGMMPPHAVLRKITPQGKTLLSPAFLPGTKNRVDAILPVDDGDYVVVGEVASQGRVAGWAMRLDDKGGLIWQREHARGSGAHLDHVGLAPGHIVVAAGTVDPSAGYDQGSAGWVMAMNADSGEIGWQRYYTGEGLAHGVRDVIVAEDGLISVVMNAAPMDEDAPDYVRLLTINPRGQLFMADEYFNGEGAAAKSMIFSPRAERVMIGDTRIAYTVQNSDGQEELTLINPQGWVVVAEPSEPYSDPCIQPFKATP